MKKVNEMKTDEVFYVEKTKVWFSLVEEKDDLKIIIFHDDPVMLSVENDNDYFSFVFKHYKLIFLDEHKISNGRLAIGNVTIIFGPFDFCLEKKYYSCELSGKSGKSYLDKRINIKIIHEYLDSTLKNELDIAVQSENFELAIIIRDELKKRKKGD